ncbi:hypothetical protein R6M67_43060 [Streptomyces sp. Wh19]|nr:hypothetical protein [Streptomyces sp. Wh19]MDV9201954.1 hypothetical protein [Streptomyces sp. Wh19]
MPGPTTPCPQRHLELLALLKQRHWPGTSKWNKVEHRLFSQITHSLRGQPLTSYEVLLRTISATRTSTGLSVSAVLDENDYPTGRKLTRAERKAVEQRVKRDEFHGEWNYTIAPHDPVQDPPTSPEQKLAAPIPPEATFLLTHPALTGMSRDQFDQLVDQVEPCRQILTDAERRDDGSDGRGRKPGFGILDHRHRVLAAILNCRNTVTLTLAGQLIGRERNVLSYHAHRTRPLLAFGGTGLAAILTRQTHPPRTLEALKSVIERHDNMIETGSS